MPGRYFIKTFGCQMNEYDSSRIGDVLATAEGLTPTTDETAADILLMNTCSVRDKAEDKVYSLLGTWRALKEQRPGVIIGVGGCVASQEGEAITARAPYVDLVFGPQTIHRLPDMLAAAARHRQAADRHQLPRDRKVRPAAGRQGAVAPARSCRSWKAAASSAVTASCPTRAARRSAVRSRRCSRRCAGLVAQGVGEITLLGQNVNAYEGAIGMAPPWISAS